MLQPDPTETYYQAHAQVFIAGTLDVDMSPLYARFMAHLPAGGRLLDAGCGSGRDSLFFRRQGYRVSAIDACAEFVNHTRAYAGVEAHQLRFGELADENTFAGIWASASLLHLPPNELPGVLTRLAKALVPGGVLYASFKYGHFSGLRNGRWFTDLDEQGLAQLLQQVPGLERLESWQSEDARPERAQERWLNCLLQQTPAAGQQSRCTG